MIIYVKVFLMLLMLTVSPYTKAGQAFPIYNEPYRGQLHFSPKKHWMNDPNGMVYFNGIYHLFFQYNPKATIWGPMHWGHAESYDLVHWEEKPIALYPDTKGYIFSGSAVVDAKNTSGFSKLAKIPLVAIFTHHNPEAETEHKNNFQNQGIAFSLNNGKTWTKYPGNPVLKNPGIRDFRDPKVRWYSPEKKWLMTLAVKNHVNFYASSNLKNWKKTGEFGRHEGAHGGVWECPDLFPMRHRGKTYWILIANIHPGGPNGGSATQYFVGHFDGKTFKAEDKKIHWLDYGPDEYAGVTWNNTGKRIIFLGWMSNWQYANKVPTHRWRNAMTIPRQLGLEKVRDDILLTSKPIIEIDKLAEKPIYIDTKVTLSLPKQFELKMNIKRLHNYKLLFTNAKGDSLVIGYDKIGNRYFIDRTKSGKIDFDPTFSKIAYAPRLSLTKISDLILLMDSSSVELFADNGLTVMTSIFFPHSPYRSLQIVKDKGVIVQEASLIPLNSIWKLCKN